MTSARGPHHYDVAILGGGLAGGCLARQLRLEAPSLRVLVVEKRHAPGARGGVQGRRIERRDRRPLFPEAARARAAPARGAARKARAALFLHRTATTATSRTGSSSARPISRRCRRFSSIAAGSRTCCFAERRASASTVLDGCRVGSIALGDDGPHRVSLAGRRTARTTSRRAGSSTPAAAPGLLKRQLGLARAEHPRRQRLLVSRAARACAWTTGRTIRAWRSRVPSGAALAEHQPPDGRRLLGLADPARLRQHQLRHRRRRRHASVPPHQPLRARDGLAARVRAAVRGGHRGARVASSRTSSPCSITPTAARASSRRTAGRSSAKPGVFTDPFYSPGSDFIAIGNDYVTDLIVRDARRRGASRRGPRRSTPPTCGCSTRSSGSTTASTRSWATRR